MRQELVATIEENAINAFAKSKDPVKNPRAGLVRRPVVLGLAVLPLAGCKPRNVAAVELHIASDGDQLAFKPDHLFCPTGADVRLFFHHAGQIIDDPHDWVLLKPGTVDAFLADADKSPDDTLVIPANDNVARLLPPLIISEAEIGEGLRRLDAAAARLGGGKAGSPSGAAQ